jgi:hypothetical protein
MQQDGMERERGFESDPAHDAAKDEPEKGDTQYPPIIPNKTTIAAMKESWKLAVRHTSVADVMADLNADD